MTLPPTARTTHAQEEIHAPYVVCTMVVRMYVNSTVGARRRRVRLRKRLAPTSGLPPRRIREKRVGQRVPEGAFFRLQGRGHRDPAPLLLPEREHRWGRRAEPR
jgi:hypothetical protein